MSNVVCIPDKPVTQSELEQVSCPICAGSEIVEFLSAPDRFHLRSKLYQLVRCTSCGTVWQAKPPSPEEMGEHYSKEYHRTIVAAGEGSATARWKSQVELLTKMKGGGTLLDLGCSSGGFLSAMKSASWELYGIEMERATAEKAMARTGATVFVGDAPSAPFLPSSFDAITCFDVLEHVYSPREVLQKAWGWLKPGGILYASMPNIASWEARAFGTQWYGLELPRHLFHFSHGPLRHLMNEIGFREISIRTPPVTYVEPSLAYVLSEFLSRFGIRMTSQAERTSRSLPARAFRKALRLSVFAPLSYIFSVFGTGPSMEVVVEKPRRND